VSRHDGYLLPRRATLLALSGVLLGMLLAALNQTILATAMPRIVADVGGGEHYSWVFSGYMLAVAVSTPLYGRLSDVYGRRPFFVAGICLFLIGAVIGATANSMTQVVVARAVQGLGAGALMPLAFAVIGDLVPPADRGRWQGLTGAMFGIASVIGPFTGGWIADNADWRWVFLVSVPVGAAALAMILAYLRIPPHPERGTRVDYIGAALLAVGLSCVLLATVRGGQDAAWGSAQILGLFGGGALVLAIFYAWERRQDQPVVPIELFRLRTMQAATLAGLTTGMGMFGTIVFVPLFMQGAMGDSATNSGLVLAPLMLAMVLTSAGSGQIITRTGRYRWALLSGPVVMAVGFALLASLQVDSGRWYATVAMTVVGLGLGLLLQNLVLVVQNSVPSRHIGAATGAAQLSRSLGNAIGVAIMGAILLAGLPAGASLGALSDDGGAAAGASAAALADALHPVFLLGVPLMVVTLALVALIPEVPLRGAVRDDVATAAEPLPTVPA
jgi:EmrB/QacA subfamily drug resistance transporter